MEEKKEKKLKHVDLNFTALFFFLLNKFNMQRLI